MARREHRGCKCRDLGSGLGQFDEPVLRRAVGLDQTHVQFEGAFRDRRAKIDGESERIAGTLRMLDNRPQYRCRGDAAERTDESPVIRAGTAGPTAIARGHSRSVIER
jgi:hypothetical protein